MKNNAKIFNRLSVHENVKMNLSVCASLNLNKAHQCSLHDSHELHVQNIPWRLVLKWFLYGQVQKILWK